VIPAAKERTLNAVFIVLTDAAGGAERVAAMLANGLSQRPGWSVEYLVLGTRQSPSFVSSALDPEIRCRFGPLSSPFAGLVGLPIALLSRRSDLVFTTHLHTNAMVSMLRRLGLPRTTRLVTRESTTLFDRYQGIRRLVYRLLYRIYGGQDMVVVQTDYMGEHVAPFLPRRARERIVTLPNPVDLDGIDRAAAQPLTPEINDRLQGRVNVVVCGRLIPVKRPEVALTAFAEARSRTTSDLQLVFVGEGAEREALEAAVRERGLKDDVVFLGRQSNPHAIMRACSFGLLTSSREGFPNVVLEMMAAGVRAVVMTPCAGDLDTLKGVTVTADFEPAGVAEALVQAIQSGADHRHLYRSTVAGRGIDPYLDRLLGQAALG
jgi:glycosyltransferase involved in cell wall biosynthesis